jgi:ribose transport system ATP-binding protein
VNQPSALGQSATSRLPQDRPAVSITGVTKGYPGVLALDQVTLDIVQGQVHALVGENGAGKSTIMKVAAGAVAQDRGTVEINGVSIAPGNPRSASDAGLAMIYQELTIIPGLTAAENAFLGNWPASGGWASRRKMRERFTELTKAIGTEVPPDATAGDLPVGQKQIIEIIRALGSGRTIVVMDEPTASLGGQERQHLHAVVDRLRRQGGTVVYISHDLDEVLMLADRVTVMREGRVVKTADVREWDKSTLVRAMLGGKAVQESGGRRDTRPVGTPRLSIRDMRNPRIDIPHLDLFPGQVVGLAGLIGSGRTEFLRALAGADRVHSGALKRDGEAVAWPRSSSQAMKIGIGLAPEERKKEGLVLGQSANTNVALPTLRRLSGSRKQPAPLVVQTVTDVGFDSANLPRAAGEFSGGNQQKILLARWLAQPTDILLLDEPTRGIDIGAKAEVFATIRKAADAGRCVVFASSDLDEVCQHADRALVFRNGRIVADLPEATTVEQILSHCFGLPENQEHTT